MLQAMCLGFPLTFQVGCPCQMVRKYEPKNGLYRGSRLSEQQVFRIIHYLFLLRPATEIAKKANTSVNTVYNISSLFRQKLWDNRILRQRLLEIFLECAPISQNRLIAVDQIPLMANEKFWQDFRKCAFHCPRTIYVAREDWHKLAASHNPDKINRGTVQWFIDNQFSDHISKEIPIHMTCTDCLLRHEGTFSTNYMNLFRGIFLKKKLSEDATQEYFLLFTLSIFALEHIAWLLGYREDGYIYSFRLSEGPHYLTQALLKNFYELTKHIVCWGAPALRDDPL